MSAPDSRQLLNKVLEHYYKRGGPIHLLGDAHDGRIALSQRDVNAAYTTLLHDGHIEQVKVSDPNFQPIPVASITGQGRVFLEQGGYRDTAPYLDRLLERAKNKPVLVWGSLILSGLSMISWVLELLGLLKG